MNELKQKYSEYDSEYLIELRGRGDMLTDIAHQTIEEIFSERGEKLPPRPTEPIFKTDYVESPSGIDRFVKIILILFLALLSMVIAKALAHTWIGVVITVGLAIYLAEESARKSKLTPAQKEHEENEKIAQEQGLTDLMVCAAEGKLDRLRELIAYGCDVNARSSVGTTALMYAARNNHPEIANALLSARADPNVKSKKGSTAIDIARTFNRPEILALFEKHSQSEG